MDRELHVPNDRPVRLVLTSQDVIHSLFIPAFRIKKDAVPGRYNQTWFRPTRIGEYDLFCAEYCGTQHSGMITKVIVEDPAVFSSWLEKAGNFIDTMPPAEAGKRIYEKRGCAQCHSLDGTASTGPTLKNLFGEKVLLTDGTELIADENYLRRSIKDPGGEVVRGFENVMPLINLNDAEINVLIAFIKSISEHYQASTQVDLGTNGATATGAADATTHGVANENTQSTGSGN